MARKKQARPYRSGGLMESVDSDKGNSNKPAKCDDVKEEEVEEEEEEVQVVETSRFVEIDRSSWTLDEHLDIAEVIVTDIRPRGKLLSYGLTEDVYMDSKYGFRFRLRNVEDYSERIKLGHWPKVETDNIFLEFIDTSKVEDSEKDDVVFSGNFDGPDDGVSGLAHLVSQKMVMVRPVKEVRVVEDALILTMRVEILRSAFDACDSLLDVTRQPWKRSMVSVMAWLRPEVTTQEGIYGIDRSKFVNLDSQMDTDDDHIESRRKTRFNAADFYDAIKPPKDAPMLEDEIPDLLPELRPYQRRAAYWMVEREKGTSLKSSERDQNQFLRPLCVPVNFLYTELLMFYNPFSGSISLRPESISSYVSGGVLADEMGLGKTVELLACIFAHRKSMSEGTTASEVLTQAAEGQKSNLKRLKIERVECKCGAITESHKYKGLWVQCDICDAWQHADCVGYSPARKSSSSPKVSKEGGCKKVQSGNCRKSSKRKTSNIVEMEGYYICQLCSELIQVSHSPVHTGATLIVCPSPILHQWHAEILRHTRPGSLKTFVYEGLRSAPLSTTPSVDISEFVSADIVLTTYDVLREDLSHDSDRNEGDRRFMRFDKRYPVIPTLLTRIFWWRVCLDEAQMVESNAAAATEMALRLHAKHRWCITGTPIQRKLDDLYGLLKFLTASPFEVRRWWVEVIKDPYERRDAGAIEFAHKFFKNIMWRSMKVQVADELQLPPQEEWLCWLLFSPIEAHFYQKQHETCLSYAHEFIRSFKEGVHKRKFGGSQSCEASDDIVLTHVEAAKLFHSLLKLRQACCHPQVGNSGLRSLQHSPMTMEEILGVLVGKSKIEGEEALRISVMALNALAGIAIIEEDLPRALSLYRESLTLAAEHCGDFHLDPLVNIHLHHNLAEIFPDNSGKLDEVQSMDWKFLQNAEEMALRLSGKNNFDEHSAKRQKITDESSSHSTSNEGYLEQQGKNSNSDLSIVGSNGDEVIEYGGPPLNTGKSIKDCLRLASKKVEHKYLAMHVSKLSQAQREFRDIYMQVCSAIGDLKNEHKAWWLEALHHIEKNEDSSKKCISKVQDTLFGNLNIPTQSRLASRFRSISGLKYVIQSSLDSLESSRVMLIERILEIDKTMEKPRDEDILLVRYCGSCQDNGKGPICVRCELRSLFQLYEAQLFLCTKEGRGGREIEVISAEEAVDIQKKNSALNQFHTGVSRTKIDSSSPAFQSEKIKMQRGVRETVKVSKSPSELEILLGVLKTFSKAWLGKDGLLAATKHLFLFEVMRKEYAPASTLATVQGQLLFAHDEVRMSISRLHLRESENDTSRDALTPEELVAASVQNTSDKIMGLSMLSRIKGQFRYLKGLVISKQKSQLESPNSSMHVDTDSSASTSQTREIDECMGKADDEACPVCHENLSDQRIVFQCGHVTCCKCLIAMSKHQLSPPGNTDDEWVMCPTCRQRTDFRNIAYVDNRRNCARKSRIPTTFQGHEKPEASIDVQGSYGTKIEEVTRRILWIKCIDPTAKVLVFSSWNDVLDVLEHALAANQISYIKMKGGRKSHLAITQFEGHCANEEGTGMRCGQQPGTKSFQVMLLLIQHGANGLNLLKAKHVILIEPLLNPAAEAQAINRVHRIGQDKPTVVHRFIMRDTVEESIYNWNRSKTSKTTISGNTKCQDKPVLTLKDVESLFSLTMPVNPPERENKPTESLMHLPPTVAAALAAERRWKEGLA